MSLGILNQAVTSARTRLGEAPEGETHILIAVDDVSLQDRAAQVRLLKFVVDNPHVTVVLGCHGDEHEVAKRLFADTDVALRRVFLGPLGRREVRQLVTRIVGSESRDSVERVLHLLHTQRLPRNPLNIAALVAVVTKQADVTDLNESGLIQSYVTLLLENPLVVDPEGLGQDYRRREVLLARLAQRLVSENVSRISRAEAERFVLDYFGEIGLRSASAGRFIDSLIARKVLAGDERGVGFRYPAFLFLFAAKWMLDHPDFAQAILEDPLRNAEIIWHAAGLERTSRDLLITISEFVAESGDADIPGVAVEHFNLLQDRNGWSAIDELEDVRALVEAPPEPPTEEELDAVYEGIADDVPETTELTLFEPERDRTPVHDFDVGLTLLARILKNSELVEDVPLKATTLKQVITGWARLTVIAAVREDEEGLMRDAFKGWLERSVDEAGRDGVRKALDEIDHVIQHYARLFLLLLMSFALRSDTGSRYLEGPLDEVLHDGPFMQETAHAFFATMLYVMLELPRWPTHLRGLYDNHGAHVFVREVVHQWALHKYFDQTLGETYSREIEGLLADIATAALPATASFAARNDQRTRAIADLRRQRTERKWAASEEIPDDDADAEALPDL